MGLFVATHGWRLKVPLSKICYTYPHTDEIWYSYNSPKNIQKYINHVTNSLSSADISIFSPKSSNFCYIKKYREKLYFNTSFLILFTFIEYLKIVSININLSPSWIALKNYHNILFTKVIYRWSHCTTETYLSY